MRRNVSQRHDSPDSKPRRACGSGRAEGRPIPAEPTAAGPQTLIPGVEPVTDKDRIRVEQERALRGGAAPMPEGGLFDEGARKQMDMLDKVAPVGGGEAIPRDEYVKNLNMDRALAKFIEDCGKK